MILCLGTTPALQRVMVFRRLALDGVNRAVTVLDGPAGKSVNVVKVLKALGEQPLAVGFLGGERGRYLRALLEAKGVELDFVTVAAQTRECVTVIDQSAGTHAELIEESPPISPSELAQLETILRRRVAGCRAVVMSGSLARGVAADLYLHGTRLARAAGALSVIDAEGAALTAALEAEPGLVKPNRGELAATVGGELKDEDTVKSAMRELCGRGARRVVVTAGKEPVLAFDGRRFWRIVPPAITPVNPIGSGDAFTAALVWRLVRGEELGSACAWASATGAANALTLMPGEVEPADMHRLAGQVRVEAA